MNSEEDQSLANRSPKRTSDIEALGSVDPSVGNTSDEWTLIKEGNVQIFQPKCVFYNRVQTFNRDLSVLVVDSFLKNEYWKKKEKNRDQKKAKRIKIIDALSATGLRSVRYAKELESIDMIDEIIANDISWKATEVIKKNVELNRLASKVIVTNEDASWVMYTNRKKDDRFMVIDLDPFGSAAPFIDAAVQSIADGGLLMVTCTDMAILCGNHSESCYAKYGSMSFKSVFCHELALRIVLRCIDSAANRYGRYITPLLSISVDFYIRLFLQVSTSPSMAKDSASKTAHIFQCNGCNAFSLQKVGRSTATDENDSKENSKFKYSAASGPVVDKTCKHCGYRHTFGGPIWSDRIHDFEFVDMLKSQLKSENEKPNFETHKRLEGILQVISEELEDVPLYYTTDNICRIMHCREPPSEVIRSAILNAGFQISHSHANRNSLKTNAPVEVLWDIMRQWLVDNSIDLKSYNDKDPGKIIAKTEPSIKVSFELHPAATPLSKELEVLRFQPNPSPHWGPGSLPRRGNEEKRSERQKKRTKLKNGKDNDLKKAKNNQNNNKSE